MHTMLTIRTHKKLLQQKPGMCQMCRKPLNNKLPIHRKDKRSKMETIQQAIKAAKSENNYNENCFHRFETKHIATITTRNCKTRANIKCTERIEQ